MTSSVADGAQSAATRQDNGRWSVADPRALPALDQKTVAIIRSLDGTWHRPFTTLELAALQSLIEPEEFLLLDGASDSAWREHIGNLVPPDAATAIAEVMGTTLLLAWGGETFVLSATPIGCETWRSRWRCRVFLMADLACCAQIWVPGKHIDSNLNLSRVCHRPL